MKTINLFVSSVVVFLSLFVAFDARSEDNNQLPLDSLLGKYEGRLQIHNAWQQENDYQTEVLSVDKTANTVSLVAQCPKCTPRAWKRNNCVITEAQKNIKFVCKTKFGDEEYIFNGETLRATGFGANHPHSISVKKVVK
jgi:hypothetical protein